MAGWVYGGVIGIVVLGCCTPASGAELNPYSPPSQRAPVATMQAPVAPLNARSQFYEDFRQEMLRTNPARRKALKVEFTRKGAAAPANSEERAHYRKLVDILSAIEAKGR